MIIRCLTILLFCLSLTLQAHAEDAPEITVRGDDELGAFVQTGLILEELGIDIDIQSGLAQVSLSATLRNETDDDVEASFAYPLPKGAVINGYALDIEGQLVDGVLMPKERAESLYTDRVTASIDPGIAARTVDNRYRTRIYPIFEDGGRRMIRLDFTVPVPTNGLRLPLSQTQPIERITIQISGDGADLAQTPITGTTAKNTPLSGDIFIPATPAKPSLSYVSGETFLTLPLEPSSSQTSGQTSNQSPANPHSIAVIWDTSFSRAPERTKGQTRAAEVKFVTEVLTGLKPKRQSLIRGANQVEFAATYDTQANLTSALNRLTYDGATDLSSLLGSNVLGRIDMGADICLLITDGQSSFGAGSIPNLPCRVFTYSADKTANTDWFGLLTSRNDGADLSSFSPRDAARRIGQGNGIQLDENQIGEIFNAENRQWLILPVDKSDQSLTIDFRHKSQSVNLAQLSTHPHRGASSFWGQRRMAEVRAKGPTTFDAVIDLSRQYGVQGKETSFLVLENADDYIEAKIAPPHNFPAESLEEYEEELAYIREEEAEDREDHLKQLLNDWEDQIDWWKTDWAKKSQGRSTPTDIPQPVIAPAPPAPVIPASPQVIEGVSEDEIGNIPPLNNATFHESISASEGDTIILTGTRRINRAGSLPPEIKVSVREWTPDRPFLKALADLDSAEFEREYLRQRKDNGDRPSFYLEIADQLHRMGRTPRAAQMALTALDLPSTTMTTRNHVADRLLMYGDTQNAISLYRDILPTAQDRPQLFHNLALALIQAGDKSQGKHQDLYYSEAFDHLVHLISEKWENDYDGIHLIGLQDLNRTLARLPKRKRRKIQKELGLKRAFYKNLHTDLRVLVDWTSDDADIDIHVIERVDTENQEEANYSNQATQMGGRISNDMTDGYGPEEYLIRTAPNGLYRIKSDYYSQDAYAEDGALKLRARIWRNFGRKTETLNTVIIEMLGEKDEYVLGEIQIGPAVAEANETE